MAITIIQKQKRKKIMIWGGFALVLIALGVVFYFVFSRAIPKGAKKEAPTTPLSEKLGKLEIKWDILEDKKFQDLESFTEPTAASLKIEEERRENPFLPF